MQAAATAWLLAARRPLPSVSGALARTGPSIAHTARQNGLPKPFRTSVVAMAQPRKKSLGAKTVKIFCAKCQAQLYKYQKSGTGALVKAFHERIVEDHTDGQLNCPQCGVEFARPAMIRGRAANKFIGGKVTMQK